MFFRLVAALPSGSDNEAHHVPVPGLASGFIIASALGHFLLLAWKLKTGRYTLQPRNRQLFFTTMTSPIYSRLIPILLCILSSCALPPQNKEATPPLVTRIESILTDPALRKASIGIQVVNLSTGQTIFSHNENKLFHPASTTKLFTTALALEYLGPQFRFKTTLATATRTNNTIKDLYLIGSGDPSLSTADIRTLAVQLHTMGVRQIETLTIDPTIFDDLQYGHGWMWDDQPYKDFAPICGLSVNRNIIEIEALPAHTLGEPATIHILPETDFIRLDNQTTTRRIAPEPLTVLRAMRNNKNTVTLNGVIAINRPEPAVFLRNIEQPALYAATLFIEECQRQGIQISTPPQRGEAPPTAGVIAQHSSAPLAEIIVAMNKESINIYAELLLKTVASLETDEPGTSKGGLILLTELLEEWGISKDGFSFADGSGVSRYNLVTPKTLTALLQKIYTTNFRETFRNSLPIAGYDGDLDWRMGDLAVKQNVQAKTGYLRGVSTLAGFIDTDSGDTVAFTIMIQHFKGSARPVLRIQDRICEQLSLL